MRAFLELGLAFGVGIALWLVATLTDNLREPWDGTNFWPFYAAALLLSALLGAFAADRAWAMGTVVVFAMLPVMVALSGAGPLIGLGVIVLGIMSLPAAGVAELASRLRGRLAAAR